MIITNIAIALITILVLIDVILLTANIMDKDNNLSILSCIGGIFIIVLITWFMIVAPTFKDSDKELKRLEMSLIKEPKEMTLHSLNKELEKYYDEHGREYGEESKIFYKCELELFDRIREAIKDDRETLVLFEFTRKFAEMKSACAGN